MHADDTTIFTNGSLKSIKNLMKFLKSYEKVSGQRISHSKSCITSHHSIPRAHVDIIKLPLDSYIYIRFLKLFIRSFNSLWQDLESKFWFFSVRNL